MGSSDNRYTQIDILVLAGAKPLSPPSKSVGLQGSRNGRILQSNALNKKRAPLPGEDALNVPPETGKARSRLDRSAMTGSLRLRAVWESPWKKYEKIYDFELGGPVEVAARKAPPIELVYIRTFSKPAAKKTLYMFRQIQDCNIVAALDAFTTDDGLCVVLEYMHVSLEQIVRSPAFPDERQLAAILGQVSSLIHARASTHYDVTIAAQPLLNGALNEDMLDDGWILAILIYCESNDIPNKSFGKRANVYPGKALLQDIFQAEVAAEQTEKKPVNGVDWDKETHVEGKELESGRPIRRDGKMLVTDEFVDLPLWQC